MSALPIELRAEAVRNRFEESREGRGTALILPGAYYSSQAPGLYFLRAALLDAGWNVVAIDYRYFLAGEDLSPANRAEAWEEAQAAYRFLAREWPDRRVLIAGKSLGSLFALRLALEHRCTAALDLVLLTPLEAQLAAILHEAREAPPHESAHPWSLFAVRCGTDDARSETHWAGLVPGFRSVHEVSLARTTHGMDSLDGPGSSLQGLARMCRELSVWLRHD